MSHRLDGERRCARRAVPSLSQLRGLAQRHRAASLQALRNHLAAQLPHYMVPGAFVFLTSLPLTPNGKIDRKGLPAPSGDAYAARTYEPPQGEVEAQLAAIWCELLEVERVGRHDNFFELGGHSLMAVTLIERIDRHLDARITLSDVFSGARLDQLAETIVNAQLAQFDPDELLALVD